MDAPHNHPGTSPTATLHRKTRGLQGSGITTGHLFFIVVAMFLVIWGYMHRKLVVSDQLAMDSPKAHLTPVTTENILKLQNLLDESKAMMMEIRTANVTLSTHGLDQLAGMDASHSVVAEELLSMKRRFAEAQREIGHCKNKLVSQSDNTVSVGEEEMRKHLKECQQQLLNAHDRSNIISASTSAQSETSGSLQSSRNKIWLIIGIPTVARSANQDYLIQTLASIRHQLPTDPNDLLYQRVKVIVLNLEGPSHKMFYEAQTMFAGGHSTPDPLGDPIVAYGAATSSRRLANTEHNSFEFITLSEEYKAHSADFQDPNRGSTPENDPGMPNKPGYRVRKQTRSVAQVLKRAKGRANYYLFLEDDMVLCPHGFNSIHYLLSKATKYSPNWLAVRASYGLNGIFIHDKDISHFYHYLVDNQVRRPPDHLAVEWFAGEKPLTKEYKGRRGHLSYRFNIFDHIGLSSTLRKEKQTTFPRCYEMLGQPTLFPIESFNPRQCPADDIWPCSPTGNRRDLELDRPIVHWIQPK